MTVMLFNKTSIYLNLESKVSYLTHKRSDKYKKSEGTELNPLSLAPETNERTAPNPRRSIRSVGGAVYSFTCAAKVSGSRRTSQKSAI